MRTQEQIDLRNATKDVVKMSKKLEAVGFQKVTRPRTGTQVHWFCPRCREVVADTIPKAWRHYTKKHDALKEEEVQ